MSDNPTDVIFKGVHDEHHETRRFVLPKERTECTNEYVKGESVDTNELSKFLEGKTGHYVPIIDQGQLYFVPLQDDSQASEPQKKDFSSEISNSSKEELHTAHLANSGTCLMDIKRRLAKIEKILATKLKEAEEEKRKDPYSSLKVSNSKYEGSNESKKLSPSINASKESDVKKSISSENKGATEQWLKELKAELAIIDQLNSETTSGTSMTKSRSNMNSEISNSESLSFNTLSKNSTLHRDSKYLKDYYNNSFDQISKKNEKSVGLCSTPLSSLLSNNCNSEDSIVTGIEAPEVWLKDLKDELAFLEKSNKASSNQKSAEECSSSTDLSTCIDADGTTDVQIQPHYTC